MPVQLQLNPATDAPGVAPAPPVLEVRGLRVAIAGAQGTVLPVDGVDLAIAPGQTMCLVGESGCGKSLTCFAIAGLLPPGGRIAAGSIRLAGQELTGLPPRRMAALRGREVAMVYQDPQAALNPVMTIGAQIAESLTLHGHGRAAAWAEAQRLLDRVGMPAAAARMRDYPHQLSGGMNQRAVIAMALACRPRLLIADEPTTALDVTIQAQILSLLREAQAELGMALLLVTHDLGVVAEMADEVAVMYAGRVVEQAAAVTLFAAPSHPYSAGLLGCLPRIERDAPLASIPGTVPPLGALPPGCAFAPRCDRAAGPCTTQRPEPRPQTGALVACHHPLGTHG
jgi:oligopeptide/dipeptide ABC transporter ATP-binding protein